MDSVTNFLESYDVYIMVALTAALIVLILLQIASYIKMSKLDRRYKKLMKGSSGKNIEDMILQYKDNVDIALMKSDAVRSLYTDLEKRLKGCIQKFAMVRYKAFDDIGSDLSFSIALMDENNDGMVITGIYGRMESTAYAKPIENGISKYDLSEEEKTAIKTAMESKK